METILGTVISATLTITSANWYEVPMRNVDDFNSIPKRTLEETWQMTKSPEYHVWVKKNLQLAKELNWRPGTHKPDGTCYACHALKPETYEKIRRGY